MFDVGRDWVKGETEWHSTQAGLRLVAILLSCLSSARIIGARYYMCLMCSVWELGTQDVVKSTGLGPYEAGMEAVKLFPAPISDTNFHWDMVTQEVSIAHNLPWKLFPSSFLIFVLLVCFANFCLSKGFVIQTKQDWDSQFFCLSLSAYIMAMFRHTWPWWPSSEMKVQPCSIYGVAHAEKRLSFLWPAV